MSKTKQNKQRLKTDDEAITVYRGIIVDNEDPTYSGRCKIRVYGKFDELDDDMLPYAKPINNLTFSGDNGSGFISVPKIGAEVEVVFNNGDIYKPEYRSLVKISDELKETLKDSYQNAHALIYDVNKNLKIYYTEKDGLLLWLDGSYVNIKSDNSIVLEHKNTQSILEFKGDNITMTSNSKIEMTSGSKIEANSAECHVNGNLTKIGANPNYSAVMAEPLWKFLKLLATAVDAKYPQTPSVLTNAANLAEIASTSNTVKTSL